MQSRSFSAFAEQLDLIVNLFILSPLEPLSVQVYRTAALLCLLVTFFLAICVDAPSTYGLSDHSSWLSRMYFHFFHAGLLHWSVNAIAVLTICFRFQIDWKYYIVAFAISTMYPFSNSMPIVGLSLWIYAVIGIITPITMHPYKVFFANIICIFIGVLSANISIWLSHFVGHVAIPIIAWQAHLYAYLGGLLYGICSNPIWSK